MINYLYNVISDAMKVTKKMIAVNALMLTSVNKTLAIHTKYAVKYLYTLVYRLTNLQYLLYVSAF